MKKILLILLTILILSPICASAGQRIVVVANSIDLANARDFIRSLDSQGRPVLRITPQQLDAHNLEKFIVILGGPDAPDGIGVQVQSLLSEKDQAFLREKRGNKKMFVKTNVWRKGQVVFIIAGNHRGDTKAAISESEGGVLSEATEARSEELAAPTANIELAIENFNFSLNKTFGFYYFHWVEYSLVHNGVESIDPMIDVEVQRKDEGVYETVFLNTNVTHFDQLFKTGDKWLDTYSEEFKLRNGYHRVIVRLRDGADSAVIKEDFEEFLV